MNFQVSLSRITLIHIVHISATVKMYRFKRRDKSVDYTTKLLYRNNKIQLYKKKKMNVL